MAHTLCSMTSFFDTFSKYPSHIFLNLSHISFSTSSSSSASAPSCGKAFSSALLASKDSVPCSVEVDICLEAAGGTSLRNGRAYDLRNVVRSGREEREGSLDNYQILGRIYALTPRTNHTRSRNDFMIHSPPLRLGASRMTPTRASSAQTRKTGRCRETRVASSLSRCSGAIVASDALFGGASAPPSIVTSAGVNLVGKRWWRADMTWCWHICVSERNLPACSTHLGSAPHIFFEFASHDALGYCTGDLLDILFECEGLDVFKDLVTIVEANRLTYALDKGRMTL